MGSRTLLGIEHALRADRARAEVPDRSGAAAILIGRGFLVATAILLLNDWVLKPAVSNWWTGKLSDIAGLYAFPLFWSAFFPDRRRVIFVCTAVGFLVWKSPLSELPLTVWNATGLWPVIRVVDYTDWIALFVLPFSFRSAQRIPLATVLQLHGLTHRVAVIASTLVAVFAFAATSRRAPTYQFAPDPGYLIAGPRDRVRLSFELHCFGCRLSAPRSSHAADTVQVGLDQTTGSWVVAYVELRDAPSCGTMATLLSVQTIRTSRDLPAIRERFVARFIEPFRSQYRAC